jgi:hypothetical protein
MAKRICDIPYELRTWDNVVRSNAHAKPQRTRKVVDVMALCVSNGSIRDAFVSGWFEIADVERPFTYEKGFLTVQVKCHWYGLKPAGGTDWMHLKISNTYQFVRRFSGDVIDNIEEMAHSDS